MKIMTCLGFDRKTQNDDGNVSHHTQSSPHWPDQYYPALQQAVKVRMYDQEKIDMPYVYMGTNGMTDWLTD